MAEPAVYSGGVQLPDETGQLADDGVRHALMSDRDALYGVVQDKGIGTVPDPQAPIAGGNWVGDVRQDRAPVKFEGERELEVA